MRSNVTPHPIGTRRLTNSAQRCIFTRLSLHQKSHLQQQTRQKPYKGKIQITKEKREKKERTTSREQRQPSRWQHQFQSKIPQAYTIEVFVGSPLVQVYPPRIPAAGQETVQHVAVTGPVRKALLRLEQPLLKTLSRSRTPPAETRAPTKYLPTPNNYECLNTYVLEQNRRKKKNQRRKKKKHTCRALSLYVITNIKTSHAP